MTKVVELFCGCGGMSLGARRAGFNVSTAFDIDPTLTWSYPINFPETTIVRGDVAGLDGEKIRNHAGDDITGIVGGPPCQGFSAQGRRDVNDPRRDLLGHFFRIVDEVRPGFFLMENVKGLSFSNTIHLLEKALAPLDSSYHILGPLILDASNYGAATKRERLFVIGTRRDVCTPLSASVISAYHKPPTTVRDAIADLQAAWPIQAAKHVPEIDHWQISDKYKPSAYALELRTSDSIFTGHRPTKHSDKIMSRFSAVEQGSTDKVGRHPRLHWDGLCPTLRAGTGSDKGSYQSVRPIHPVDNRVITVREGARLQGFPDAHIFHPTIWHSFRMIGNSVSPVIATAILTAIREHIAPRTAVYPPYQTLIRQNTTTHSISLSD